MFATCLTFVKDCECLLLHALLRAFLRARGLLCSPDHDHGPGGCVPMMAPGWCGAVEQARSGGKGKMDEREEAVGDGDGAEDPLSGPAERAAGLLVLLLCACVCLARTCVRASWVLVSTAGLVAAQEQAMPEACNRVGLLCSRGAEAS